MKADGCTVRLSAPSIRVLGWYILRVDHEVSLKHHFIDVSFSIYRGLLPIGQMELPVAEGEI